MSEPRFYVFDRAAGRASDLTRFSAVNPRYSVIDRTTGAGVDEMQSRRSAAEIARDLNTGRLDPVTGKYREVES